MSVLRPITLILSTVFLFATLAAAQSSASDFIYRKETQINVQ
jgi:hypothetical protein